MVNSHATTEEKSLDRTNLIKMTQVMTRTLTNHGKQTSTHATPIETDLFASKKAWPVSSIFAVNISLTQKKPTATAAQILVTNLNSEQS